MLSDSIEQENYQKYKKYSIMQYHRVPLLIQNPISCDKLAHDCSASPAENYIIEDGKKIIDARQERIPS